MKIYVSMLDHNHCQDRQQRGEEGKGNGGIVVVRTVIRRAATIVLCLATVAVGGLK